MLSDDPVDLRGHTEVGRLGATYVSNKSGRKRHPECLPGVLSACRKSPTLSRRPSHTAHCTVVPRSLLRDERLGHTVHQDGVCFALDELGS